jgi:hypothetical protein
MLKSRWQLLVATDLEAGQVLAALLPLRLQILLQMLVKQILLSYELNAKRAG